MQLEQLQQQWQRLDEKLERTIRMNGELLRLTVLQPARRRLNRTAFWPAVDALFCAVAFLLTGSFVVDHRETWSLVVLAGVLMLAAGLLLNGSIRQLILVSEVDWSCSVGAIQIALSRLRIAKIRQFKWTILLSPLVGFCGLIVGLQFLLDRLPERHLIVDKLDPWWIAANLAFGMLFIPFGQAVVSFIAKRFGNRGWWQTALDDVSGSSMKKTNDELNRWAELDDTAPTDTE